ncbi:MAG: hypothetical protein QM765_41915 [Myxococcales bacterium]
MPPRPPGAENSPGSQRPISQPRASTCPECGHAWDAHDALGCSVSLLPETATWAGQETGCDCERARPGPGDESGSAA